MTDTGQVPGEGLPESAGMVEQPGVPPHGAYTYLSETTAEDEDLLLLPGAQSPWGNEVAPPAPEPVVETVHEPGPHETAGRDSGSVDLNGVRLPDPTPAQAPSQVPPRRPLHLGPPTPNASASPVRSLADRGPTGAPVWQSGPPTSAGPEYLDASQPLSDLPPQGASPWGAPSQAAVQMPVQAPVTAEEQAAETVVPAEQASPELVDVSAAVPAGAPVAVAGVEQEPAYDAPAAPNPEPNGDAAYGGPDPEARGVEYDHGLRNGQVPVGVSAAEGGHGAGGGFGVDGEQSSGAGFAAEGVQGVDAGFAVEGGQGGQGVEPGIALDGVPGAEAGFTGDGVPGVPVVPVADDAYGVPAESVPQDGQADVPVLPVAPDAGSVDAAWAGVDAGEIGGTFPEAGHVADVVPDAAPEPEFIAEAEPVGPDASAQVPENVPASDSGQFVEVAPEAAQAFEVPDAEPAPLLAAVPEPAVVFETPAPEAVQDDFAAHAVAVEPTALAPAVEPALEPTEPDLVEAVEVLPFPAAPDDTAPAPAPQLAEPVAPAADIAVSHEPPVQPVDPELIPWDEAVQSAAPDPEAHVTPVPDPVTPLAAATSADTDTPSDALPEAPEAQPTPAPQGPVTGNAPEPAVVQPGIPLDVAPEQPVGQFVPVEGSVPTTPHLAPTPPHPLTLPAEEEPVAAVPAPREADPDLVQHAEDLETRAAEQEESTAVVAEVRQSTGPAAPAYDDAEREAVLKVMRERRDIRNGFRSDPIPHDVLLRVLEAAHTAPSVGHSQPWDFVVIRSAETRSAMHELAQRQREAYAKSLPKGRAKQFKELKIEAILDTPVNIVVTADPTRGGRHTLGRHTQPQMAPYSAALAVENLWLAARAEGLGVGWVSFFDEREMVRGLGLPEHLEVIAYLCVGYVDEFPDEPELMQAGWSKRRPLSWVVHEETYGRRALPGEDPHDLLGETVSQIRPLDAKALGEAWERQKRMTKPPGSLGMLEIISAQLSGLSRQCPPPIPEPAAVAIFAGDHGVHAQGVTPWPQEVTAQMVANFLGGGAVCNAFATQVGAEVCVVDVGVASELPATPGLLPRKIRAGTSDMTTGPAMTREEAKQAIEVGIETARDLVAAGNKALLTGEMGIANTTASAALISVYTDTDPAEVTGRGTGINDETLARKTEVVRRAIELHQPDPADPIGVLAAIGGFEHAAIVGLLLGGASLRTPVILDGVSAGAAALVARAIAPEVLAACIAGHRSAEPGHVAALNKLGLRPLVDLDLRLGEGTGALLALPLVQSTARAMHEVATFDSAGVTEK
ncbi:nicotinate-nucleotide--dimethylbenzimidazole phosphoribosyltransferase [Streptomyces pseudovenezuelae]|uniref:Nicotinate-nucleotide--dimethylbenzimidazole phosphoribosyltransferase n=1 Tax=Streptomyces pseudovenezuelae TaxID=67350 RepID=A0ABT6LL65_9ACTN|nr:nicotinate-nucleotide--dimethylbenzimidazole phosphoribosyltransferase [Streptomyces pseudovenezuelae]MDH6217051.1 nicotinate-nucleotide--dimethylbenzimidazole phosphoribosyltransferase [Streptomyces pseudovenezuelae]